MSKERKAPLISVITVARNNLHGLKKTHLSLFTQQGANFEQIIIDGASTDGTPSWLESIGRNSRVKWVSEVDSGIYDAMNKGLSLAEGELVVFMNSGDTFAQPQTLSLVSRSWQDDPSWDWGYGCIRFVDESGIVVGGAIQAPFKRSRFHLGLNYVPHQATYMSTELLKKLRGFSQDFGIASDQELIMRASLESEPKIWIDFLADFELGGAHSNVSALERERLWRRMRVKNGTTLAGSFVLDWIFTSARATRPFLGSLYRKVMASKDTAEKAK